MKKCTLLIAGLLVSMMFVFSHSTSAFAHGEEHSSADIQILRDAAAALQQSNPELSMKLTKYADREAEEQEEEEEYEKK